MARLSIPDNELLEHDLVGSDMDLIEQLVEFRRLKKMTQQQVAERMGVDRSAVSRFESISGLSAKNHTMRTARKYAEAVGAFIAHLVVDGEPRNYQKLAEVVEDNLLELRRSNEAHERTDAPVLVENLRQIFQANNFERASVAERRDLTWSFSSAMGGEG